MARSAGVKFSANIVGIHLDLVSQTADEPADRILGSRYLAKHLALARRVGDVAAGLEPVPHCGAVLDHRAEPTHHRPAVLINPAGMARTRIC